jgi:DNA-binding protein H-NS
VGFLEKCFKRRTEYMEKKTKKELLELIKEKEKEIGELKEQAKKAEQYEQFEDSARDFKALYDSFVKAGFSEEQAFTLVHTSMGAVLGKPSLFGR